MNKAVLDRLKQLVKQSDYTLDELAKHLGYSGKAMVSHILTGKTPMKVDVLMTICELIGADPSEVLNADMEVFVSVPIIGNASCGVPKNHEYSPQDYVKMPYRSAGNKNYYAVIADGDSMQPRISDGDIVICSEDEEVKHGDIVHYTIGGESGIKKCSMTDSGCVLLPLNQAYDPIYIDDESDVRFSRVMHTIQNF